MASDFFLGGLASTGAIIFTNPLEVIKTRMQLQGELAKRGTYAEPYKGVFHAFVTVVRNDGWLGLQKGLVPSLWFQFTINAFRLSIYNTAEKNKWMQNAKGENVFALGLLWGAIGGAVGGWFSSPFFMVKIQLQSKASKEISVGYQHKHTSMSAAFRQIYKETGVRGLWRGATASVPRATVGSGVQIATFAKAKYLLKSNDIVTQSTLNSFAAGLLAGSLMSLAITPLDVISTRLYNQGLDKHGRGLLYNGYMDCLVKISRQEGIYGLYKGFWPQYLRFAPHSALVLLFFDELLALRDRMDNVLLINK